jgi:hypothetical protein
MTGVFQFRESDGVEFIRDRQELTGQVVQANGDQLLVQLQADCSVMYWISIADVKIVRRGGTIYPLNQHGKNDDKS